MKSTGNNLVITKDAKQRKKRVCLSIEQKISIVRRLDKGEKYLDLAHEFGVSRQTIAKIVLDRNKILEQDKLLKFSEGNLKKKKFAGVEETQLEKVIISWCAQKKQIGLHISENDIKQIALIVNERMNGPPSFKASNGWIRKFQQRHGLQLVPNIPNIDKPASSVTCSEPVHTEITRPRPFFNIDSLPEMYPNKRNSWMNKNIFMKWFTNVFIPSLQEKTAEFPKRSTAVNI